MYNKFIKTYESFNPEEEWEEFEYDPNDIQMDELTPGRFYIFTYYTKDPNGYPSYLIKYRSHTSDAIYGDFYYYLGKDGTIEKRTYGSFVPKDNKYFDLMIRIPTEEELKIVDEDINESFEPEEEWVENDYIDPNNVRMDELIPGEVYVIKFLISYTWIPSMEFIFIFTGLKSEHYIKFSNTLEKNRKEYAVNHYFGGNYQSIRVATKEEIDLLNQHIK